MAHMPFKKTVDAPGASLAPGYIANASGSVAANVPAGLRVNSSGIIEIREGTVYSNVWTWLVSGASSDYDFRMTLTSGSTPSGTLNTWLNGGTSREWTIQDTVGGVETFSNLLLEVSVAGAATAFDSATVQLTSEHI